MLSNCWPNDRPSCLGSARFRRAPMDLALTPEQEATRRTVAEGVDAVVVPGAIRNDREERFPQEALDGLKRDGWVGLTISEEYGGGGADPLTYCLVIEELGRGDANVRSLLSVHLGLVGGSIVRWGTEEQKQEWLPRMATGEALGCFCLTEPDHGSDPASLESTAVREGDSYRINGSTIFLTNGDIAGDDMVMARSGGPIAAFHLVQELIAYAAVEVEAARLLTWRVADLKMRGQKYTLAASMAKFYASEMCVRAANAAVQVHGGYGYVDEFVVGKLLR